MGRDDGPDIEEALKPAMPSIAVVGPISADERGSIGNEVKADLMHLAARLKNKRLIFPVGAVLIAGVALAALAMVMSSGGGGEDTRLAERNAALPEQAGGDTRLFAAETSPTLGRTESPAPFERPAPEAVPPSPAPVPETPAETPRPVDGAAGEGILKVESSGLVSRPTVTPPTPSGAKPAGTTVASSANTSPAPPKQRASHAPTADTNPLAAILEGSDSASRKLPVGLSRQAVQRGMNKVAGRARQCSKTEKRPVVVSVTIARNGTVSSAVATGDFAGTQIGACVARAAKAARFPPSVKETTVHYPFFP